MNDFEPSPFSGENDKPIIFSKNSIWIFSLFFSVLAGMILMRINLKSLGYEKKAREVIVFGVSFMIIQTVAAFFLMQITPHSQSLTLIMTFIGTSLLYHFYWERVIPSDLEYEKRSTFVPLIICFLIILPLLLMMK